MTHKSFELNANNIFEISSNLLFIHFLRFLTIYYTPKLTQLTNNIHIGNKQQQNIRS
jgi:hypothetical protein